MYISIDLGGTNTRIATSLNLTDIKEVHKFKTEDNFLRQKYQINDTIEQFVKSINKKVEGVAIGVPGTLDLKKRKFGKIMNFPPLSGRHFDDLIDERFVADQKKIFAMNDAALAGLGEAYAGAGKAYETIAYITLSTSVGGARIAHKKIDNSQLYFEPGQHIINPNGNSLIYCTEKGCFAAYASGTAFKQSFGISPEKCADPKIWSSYARHLSIGLYNILCFWAPEAIILGGGVSKMFKHFHKPLQEYLAEMQPFSMPDIKQAELLDDAGIIGGFQYLKGCLNL
ncbi:ROK family protein [Candidatus Nomurabacteria bacterium]|uniref:ROK family protein n=1 Tax=candidate division WWE3 bacterium TaxID=2053526 RepID=A0A955E0C2_UNCKA|nr:ROK family protein [candidate division WWE3 bacterium]MCB9823537.1 ROK family protein [Candidatus Nomurabacteria bacterium]MCB9827332.1 ROK family protein [Candidatus Nomurabacteria bacterium]HXK52488.1 ROK family protein [bacterium]